MHILSNTLHIPTIIAPSKNKAIYQRTKVIIKVPTLPFFFIRKKKEQIFLPNVIFMYNDKYIHTLKTYKN